MLSNFLAQRHEDTEGKFPPCVFVRFLRFQRLVQQGVF
jgi:hypothetical protein